jgi:hypothetical protein
MYMKNIVIVILVAAVLVFGYIALKPKPIVAPTVPETQTQVPDTTQPGTSSSNQSAVAGMQEYTDTNFGFSFWYPTDWKLSTTNANPAFGASITNATITKRLWLTHNGDTSPSILIQEAHSTTRTITDTGGAGPIGPITYYFDPNKHLWMTNNAATAQAASLTPANISNNTMGGLHLFPGTSRFNTTIIPLSADNFVVIGDNGGTNITAALAKTVLALDPSVATPVSAAEQTKTIQAEANQNDNVSNQSSQSTTTTSTTGWKTYSNTQYGFSFQYPSDWKLTDNPTNKTVTIATNDAGEAVEGMSYPTYSITFKSTDKTFFSKPIYTKWGGVTYDENSNAILIDGNCTKPDEVFGSMQAVHYGGSLMSDPAYNDSAITTMNKTIFIIHEEQGGSLSSIQSQIQTVENSFKLLGGNSPFIPQCKS